MKKITILLVGLAMLNSCQRKDAKETPSATTDVSAPTTITNELVGKKIAIVYEQFKAEITYQSDSLIHWKTTDNTGKLIGEADQKVLTKILSPSHYFVNWIEKDGLTVSQVVDTQAKHVTSFVSYKDDKSPTGQRSSMLLEGDFKFLK